MNERKKPDRDAMKRAKRWTVGLGLALAVATGVLLVIAWRTGRRADEAVARAERQGRELAELRAIKARGGTGRVHRPGEADERHAAAEASSVQNMAKEIPAAARWRVLADLQRRDVLKLRLPLVNGATGEIAPAFRELSGFTAEEAAAFDRAWQKARQKIESLVETHATAQRDEAGRLVIYVGRFEGGAAVFEELMGAVAPIVGAGRMEAFGLLFSEQLGEALHQFGAEERWLTLQRDVAGSDGLARYRLREQRTSNIDASNRQVMATPQSGPVRANGTRTGDSRTTLAEFAARYGALAKLVPPGF